VAIAESISGETIGEAPERPPIEPPVEEIPPTSKNSVQIDGTAKGDIRVVVNDSVLMGDESSGGAVELKIKLIGDVTLVINGQEFNNVEAAPPPEEALLNVSGKCSWFGGPDDTGVSPSEGLAFIYNYSDRPDLFLPQQPPGTSGLARRLNPDVYYVACRWDYDVTPKTMLAKKSQQARVRANGKEFLAWPADWGPNENTGRVADLSKGLLDALGITTDDQVEVTYPVAPVVA
jgi:hypothetical protein